MTGFSGFIADGARTDDAARAQGPGARQVGDDLTEMKHGVLGRMG